MCVQKALFTFGIRLNFCARDWSGAHKITPRCAKSSHSLQMSPFMSDWICQLTTIDEITILLHNIAYYYVVFIKTTNWTITVVDCLLIVIHLCIAASSYT